ncbi:MAG: hypothetical protein AB2L14_06795, partial [Candidatus Xenobiia bacterium LiM19]
PFRAGIMSRAKSFWEKHIKMFPESGMNQKEYCIEKGLKRKALKYHLYKNPGKAKEGLDIINRFLRSGVN